MGPMMMATASEPGQPPQQNGHGDPRTQLDLTIDRLLTQIWEIMVQLNDYNPDNKWALSLTLSELAVRFEEIHKLREKIENIEVPLEVIEYIDEGRNPDKFMVDYVEEVIKENDSVNIKNEAIQNFSELLLEQLQESFPDQTAGYKQYQLGKSKPTNGH